MKKKYLFLHSINFKIPLVFLIFLILPFSFIIFMLSNQLKKESYENASTYMINNLKSVSENVDEILKNVEFMHTPILTNNDFISSIKYLKPKQFRNDYNDYNMLTHINNALANSFITNNYVDSIYLYGYNSETYFSNKGYTRITDKLPKEANQWFSSFDIQNKDPWVITKSTDNEIIISSYRIIQEYKSPSPMGLLSINVNSRVVRNLLENIKFNTTGYSFVSDKSGNVILSNSDEGLSLIHKQLIKNLTKPYGYFTKTINNQLSFITYYVPDYSKFVYITIVPIHEVTFFSSMIRNYSIYVYIFMILTIVIFVTLIYYYFYTPITNLFSAMKLFEKGNFNVRLEENRHDEIGYINKNFNGMVQNLTKLIKDNYVNKLLRKDAQLKSIQSQINEHFLYNTLDIMHWTARKYKAPQLCDMIFSLSKFYRLSLSNGKDLVSIREVLEIINSYIYIQKIRMQDSLKYEYFIDESIYEVKVLKYLFQPLIENAIVHGIEKKRDGGSISVSFKKSEDQIRFEVKDTGIGIDPENLATITKQLNEEDEYFEHCFAIRNINSQIKLSYGNEYSLKIVSVKDEGTSVWFDFPITKEEED